MPHSDIPDHSHHTELLGGQIRVWIDQRSSLMLKVNQPHGDPIELGENELEELITVLTALQKVIAKEH